MIGRLVDSGEGRVSTLKQCILEGLDVDKTNIDSVGDMWFTRPMDRILWVLSCAAQDRFAPQDVQILIWQSFNTLALCLYRVALF